MSQDKTVSWHIPRVTLSSSSSSSSGSNYHGSIEKIRRNSAPYNVECVGSQEMKYFSKSMDAKYPNGNGKKLEPDKRRMSCDVHMPRHKRGSHSSQGSSHSNLSSSSLQLTVANLENFARTQGTGTGLLPLTPHRYLYANNNIMFKEMPIDVANQSAVIPIVDHHQNLLMNLHNFNINFNEKSFKLPKIKDYDDETSSIASSTHFTVVNGFGTPSRFKDPDSRRLCSRTHQVTIVIVTMTILFIIAIIFTVCAMEMRAREMPRS